MVENQRMEESKLLAIMEQNDAPMGTIVFVWEAQIDLMEKLGKVKSTSLDTMQTAYDKVKKVYDRINIDVQTEETGRRVLVKTKSLLEELGKLARPFIEEARASPEKLPALNPRIKEIIEEIRKGTNEYLELPAYTTYREHKKNYGGLTRSQWFEQGKPEI